jgi:hypothetical protein
VRSEFHGPDFPFHNVLERKIGKFFRWEGMFGVFGVQEADYFFGEIFAENTRLMGTKQESLLTL